MNVDGIFVSKANEIADASIVSGEINESGYLVLTNGAGTEINAGLVVPPLPNLLQIDAFTNTAITENWSIPDGAKYHYIFGIGGGGGGGAGNVSGSDTASGAGGGGGGFNDVWLPSAALLALGTDFRVDVRGGGEGGQFAGGAGADGEGVEFWLNVGGTHYGLLSAPGGFGGGSGNPAVGAQDLGGAPGNIFGGKGGGATGSFDLGGAGAEALKGGGGGGGGINSSGGLIQSGSPGGSSGGRAFYSGVGDDLHTGGTGGLGGSAHTTAPIARPGSAGSLYGGGGGGGSGVDDQSSIGGNGGQGIIVILTYF